MAKGKKATRPLLECRVHCCKGKHKGQSALVFAWDIRDARLNAIRMWFPTAMMQEIGVEVIREIPPQGGKAVA